MSKPDGAMAIGRHLYLFTAKVPTDECLISAHGGGLSGNVMFSVPSGVSVHFYVPHGFTLQDPGIALAAARRQPTETVVGPGQCHDYELSKFQGRHGNNAETYESISTRVERESADLLKYRRRVADASSDVMRQGAQVQLDSVHPFHAVTIRNRFASADMRLSEVIRKVREVMPMIKVFHCSFCRSPMHADAGMSAKAGQI